jgi:hypothetical protein
MPPIEFSKHARRRIRERKITEADVSLVLSTPDSVSYGRDGETIAVKRIHRKTIQIVYRYTNAETVRVITVVKK